MHGSRRSAGTEAAPRHYREDGLIPPRFVIMAFAASEADIRAETSHRFAANAMITTVLRKR